MEELLAGSSVLNVESDAGGDSLHTIRAGGLLRHFRPLIRLLARTRPAVIFDGPVKSGDVCSGLRPSNRTPANWRGSAFPEAVTRRGKRA
jgi:hypothetical protein